MKYKKHELIMYLENHSNYLLSIAAPLITALAMGGFCLFSRQDPVALVLFLTFGTGFYVSGVAEAVPLLQMDWKYPGSLREGQDECPPIRDGLRRSLRRMAIGTAFLLVAGAIAMWLEFPYL